MALSVAEVLIRWRQEGNKEVEASTKRLGETVTQMGDRMKTAGAVLSAGLTAPLVLMGKQAIDAASDLNEATSAVETVFGRTADEMVRFSQSAATNLGQSQQAALGAASALGALFQGVGLNNDQMAEFSQNVLTASADLASFYNVDPGQALQNLRSGLVGEAEPLRRFGILLNEASVEAKAVELGLIAVGDEMTEAQKVQARYAVIMEQLGAAQGDFARTSDSLANRQRVLTARMQDMRAEIGQFLLPYALQLSEVFSRLLDRFLNLDEGSKRLAVTIGAVAAAAGPALLIFGQFLSTAGKLAPLFAALTGPLGLVALGVAGLALAWQQNWFGIRDITRTVIDGVLQTLGRMVEFFQHAKDRGLDPFRLAFRTLIVTLGERLGRSHPIVDFLQEVLRLGTRLGETFANRDFTGFLDELDRAGGRLGTWLGEQFNDARTFGANLLQTLMTSLQGVNWGQLGERLREFLGDMFAWRQELLGTLLSFGGEVLQTLVRSLQGVNWGVVGQTIRDGLGQFADWVGDRLGEALAFGGMLLQRIMDGLRGINWDAFGSAVQAGLQGALSLLRDLGGWIVDRLREVDWPQVYQTMVEFGRSAVNAFVAMVRNGALALKDLATWVNDRLSEVDWAATWETIKAAGSDLIGQLLKGLQERFADVGAWISGSGTGTQDTPGLGSQLHRLVSAAFAAIKDSIIETGKAPFQWLWDGMKAKWDEILAWAESLTLPTLPGQGEFEDPASADARRRQAEREGRVRPDDGTRALGGPLGRGWTLVGEAGPELISPQGMVIPHGASMARLRGWLPGLAMGGMTNLTRQQNRLFQRLLGRGVPEAYAQEAIANDYLAYFGSVGEMIRHVLGQERRLARRSGMDRPGFRLAEDGSWVRDRYYDSGREARRQARLQHQMNSDRLNRANDYGDRTGDYSRKERVLRREARSGEIYEGGLSRQEREFLLVNHGTIHVHPPDERIGRRIAEQFATRNR